MIALIGCPTEDDGGSDPAPIASVSVSPVSVNEGETVTATVTLDSALDSAATFTLALGATAATDDADADVDGADDDDDATFSGGSNTAEVSIATGVLTGSAEITIVDDNASEEAEDNETFTVGLTAGTNGVTLSAAVATVTISRNDQAMATQVNSFSASSSRVSEGGEPATITIDLDGPAITPLSFGYTIGDVDAADIVGGALSDTIDVALGAQSGTATISAANDTLIEGDETMIIKLASTNAPLTIAGSVGQIQLTIGDDDTLSVELAAATYRFKEGDTETDFGRDDPADVATIVMLSVSGGELVGSDEEVSDEEVSAAEVSLTTVAGTATEADFMARSGVNAVVPIPFDDYTTAQTVSVPLEITDDAILEIDETFRLELSESDPRVGVGTENAATVTIVERFNNELDIVVVTWRLDRLTANEGSAIETTIELESGSFGFDADFHMEFVEFPEIPVLEEGRAADVDGMGDNDDAVFSIGSAIDTITIPDGESINTGARINIRDDTTEEDEEVFLVGLSLSEQLNREIRGNSISLSGPNTREVTIPRNDQEMASQVTGFTATSTTIGEGGAVTIEIVLDGEAQSQLSFGYAITGIAAADIVGNALNGTIGVAIGAQSGTATISAANDTLIEGDETMTIMLGALPTDSGSGTPLVYATGVDGVEEVTITDNDTATVSIAATTATAVEGGADGEFTVSLTGGTTTAAVVVPLNIGGDAVVGDYTLSVGSTALVVSAGSTSLTIPSGAPSATITVAAAVDVDTTDETLTLTIGTGITGGGRDGAVTLTPTETDRSASVTLQDDDYSVTVSPPSTAAEPSTDGVFTITLDRAVSAGTVTVDYTVSGTATRGTDYTDLTDSVMIAEGARTAGIVVDVIDDDFIEGDETVILTIDSGSAPGGGLVSVGSPAPAEIIITDNDKLMVAFASTPYSFEEGQTAPPTNAMLSVVGVGGGMLIAPVDVEVTTTGGTANSNVDFMERGAGASTINIPAADYSNPMTLIVPLVIIDDNELELDETFTLTLSATDPRISGVVEGTALTYIHDTATVIITDNDDTATASLTVNGEASVARVPEGPQATATITLDNPVDVDLDFTLRLARVLPDRVAELQGTGIWTSDNSAAIIDDLANLDATFSSEGAISEATSVTIPRGMQSVDRSIYIIDDNLIEFDDAFDIMLSLVTPDFGSKTISADPSLTLVVIENDDTATISIQPLDPPVTTVAVGTTVDAFKVVFTGSERSPLSRVTLNTNLPEGDFRLLATGDGVIISRDTSFDWTLDIPRDIREVTIRVEALALTASEVLTVRIDSVSGPPSAISIDSMNSATITLVNIP